SFEPTYKELKLMIDRVSGNLNESFEPTYKELKHFSNNSADQTLS
ncbi:MAG: hypothetical protein JG778_1194, partial [Thermodesulfobacterium sp.]|nr:hypothetical protein [Thermodesulfobacterium sp.]